VNEFSGVLTGLLDQIEEAADQEDWETTLRLA